MRREGNFISLPAKISHVAKISQPCSFSFSFCLSFLLGFDLQLSVELRFSMVELNPFLWYKKPTKTTKCTTKFD